MKHNFGQHWPSSKTWLNCGGWIPFIKLFFLNRDAAKSIQSCPTLCDPIDGSPPGSPVPGILQARTPEWVATSFSNAWRWKEKVKSLSRVQLLATPWTAAYQAPPSMGFSRQEYWSGVPLPSPNLSNICEKKPSYRRLSSIGFLLCNIPSPTQFRDTHLHDKPKHQAEVSSEGPLSCKEEGNEGTGSSTS